MLRSNQRRANGEVDDNEDNDPLLHSNQLLIASSFDTIRDRLARVRIDVRIRRLSLGNPGDVKPVGEGVSELRIDHGPGYRV